jgi:hypothetical protein
MMTIPAASEMQLFNGMTKTMVLACPVAGGASFRLHGVL